MINIQNINFQNSMKGILHFFQLCNYFPFYFEVNETITVQRSSLVSSLLGGWMIMTITGFFGNAYLCFGYPHDVFNTQSIIGYTNDVLKYITGFLVPLIGFCESVYQFGNQELIWTKLKALESEPFDIKESLKVEFQTFYRNHSIKFLAIQFLLTFIDILILCLIQYSPQWVNFWCLTKSLVIFCRARLLFLMFYIDLLAVYLKVFLNELNQVKKTLEILKFMPKSDSNFDVITNKAFKRLCHLKLMYGEIWYTATDVSEHFGWSVTLNFIQIFVQITCDSYWLYDIVKFSEYIAFFPTLLCLAPSFIILLAPLKTAEDCLKLVGRPYII